MSTVSHLIAQFVPEHYDLSLTIDDVHRTFSGVVTIHGQSVQPHTLSLHAKELRIDALTVDGHDRDVAFGENDELIITGGRIDPGEHVIVATFGGTITDAMHGLYPSHYTENGEKKTLFATQFESHHAREVFPCIDEPAAKATFSLTLTTRQAVVALSNQPVDWQRVENDRLVTAFQTTPRMSTYLLAWVVGDLHRKTAFTKEGTEVSVWATPVQPSESLDFALDIAVRSIEFYNDYFGTPYPLPKSDHVALPDFSSGAMENWGLITYREVALLADPASTSVSSKHYIATVIAHELAHQWFGNLVTMKWWNNLWLNESFATLMEYIAVDALHPEWHIWDDFSSNERVSALRRDAIDGVQSVQTDVFHPEEISTLFDPSIVYAKGACLLAMLRTYVGDEVFRAGLADYFNRHAYQNTEGSDLWDALARTSGKNIAPLMESWISQPGYPVVNVSQSEGTITLTQTQFFIGAHKPSDRRWPIPLNSPCSEMPSLLTETTVAIERHHTTPLILNDTGASYFITHYSDPLFARIIEMVRDRTLSTRNRLMIVNDATLLVRAGSSSSSTLIPLIEAFHHETSEPVWSMLSLAFAELRKFVDQDTAAETALRSFSATLGRPLLETLGWEQQDGEPADTTKLRSIALGLVLYGEDPAAKQWATRLFETTEVEHINPNIRHLVLSSVVRDDTAGDVSLQLLELYKTTQNAELSEDICSGLTSTRNPDTIERIIAALTDETIIRHQDVMRWFAYLIRSRDTRAAAWQWMRDHWQWISDTFAGDKSYDVFPRYAASGLATREQLDEYIAFFAPLQHIPSLRRVITLGINELTARVELIEKDKEAVAHALLTRHDQPQ